MKIIVSIILVIAGLILAVYLYEDRGAYCNTEPAIDSKTPEWLSGGSVLILPADYELTAEWDSGMYIFSIIKIISPLEIAYNLVLWRRGEKVYEKKEIAILSSGKKTSIELFNEDGKALHAIGGNVFNVIGDAKYSVNKMKMNPTSQPRHGEDQRAKE